MNFKTKSEPIVEDSTSKDNSHSKTNKKIPSGQVLNRRLVDILEQLLNSGDWDNSLFLRKAKERLQELHEEAKSLTQKTSFTTGQLAVTTKPQQLAPGIVRVYITLYHTENNLQNWLHTLKTLAIYNVTRPTYRSESHVKEIINSKAEIMRHGYAEVLINEKDIIPINPQPVDTLGHELLLLKEGSVHLSNIISFVHANKKRYILKDNNLVFDSDITHP